MLDLTLAKALISGREEAINKLGCLGRYGFAIGFSIGSANLRIALAELPEDHQVCLRCPFKVDCHRQLMERADRTVYQLNKAGKLDLKYELQRPPQISKVASGLIEENIIAGHEMRQKDLLWTT